MSQLNTTPEGFRTAAYLATRARLDAARTRSRSGKTSRSVDCNPPNVKCGGRCIPPSWDCRLKGEGPDPHLRAVKTDPLSGFANIQRGVQRVSRGVTRGNFSEVEGGKRAIIRGVVKTVPGDIQQKKQLKATLENRTRAIGIGLAVVTGGLGMHALLMKSNLYGYSKGWGQNINQATRAGVSRVLDSIPVLGTQRRATRTGVQAGVEAAAARASAPAMNNSAIPGTTVLSATDRESHSDLRKALKKVNEDAASGVAGTSGNFVNWNQKHRETFWGADRSNDLSLKDAAGKPIDRISIYAEPTAQEYLGNQFGVPAGERTSRASIKSAMQARLTEERSQLVSLAKQQGFRTIRGTKGSADRVHYDDIDMFVRGIMRNNPISDTAVRQRVEAHVRSVLTDAPSTYTNKLYNASIVSFDTFYKETSAGIANIPGAPDQGRRIATPLTSGSNELLRNADTYRSTYLAGEMRARTQMAGPAHTELVQVAYYNTRVFGTTQARTYEIPDRLAFNAASELSGRSITSRTEAIGIINRETGFSGARIAPAAAPRTRATPPARTTPRVSPPKIRSSQRNLSTLARSIMARPGNENMSLEAALRQARAEIARRGDSADLPPRVAAYLQMRSDFVAGKKGQGKPCGESHIPKAHECRKGRGAESAPASPKSGGSRGAITAGVAVAGAAIAVGGLLAYKQRSTIVPNLSQKTINSLSTAQVKAGLDKLPEKFRDPARQLVGGAKKAAAHMALKAQGGQIRAVDIKNNFSTWQMPNGTQMSVGSVGDSLLTFGAERKGNISKFPQYGLGFTIDSSYDAKGGMPGAQAKQLVRTTKAMYKAQLDMLPENAVMFAVPHKADGKGGKRKSIYEGMGFKPIPGLKTDRLWALKNQGNFTEIPDSQMEYMANLIRGDEEDTRTDLKCGKGAISEGEKCSKGAATRVDPKGTRVQAGQTIAKVALAAGVVGGAAFALRKAKLGEFHTGVMTGNVGGVRKRRMSFMEKNQTALNSDQLANTFTDLKKQKGVIPENVDALQSFIRKANLVNDPANFYKNLETGFNQSKTIDKATQQASLRQVKLMNTLGGFDGLASQYSDNVYVRSTRKDASKLNADPQEVTNAVNRFMDLRAGTSNYTILPSDPNFKKLFTISSSTKNGDAAEYINTIHEIAHKVHFKASINAGGTPDGIGLGRVYNPLDNSNFMKTNDKKSMNAQLRRSSSGYGLSDYEGRKAETFAELSVLYVTQGERFKKDNPLAYAWVDDIWKTANG